MRTGQVTN